VLLNFSLPNKLHQLVSFSFNCSKSFSGFEFFLLTYDFHVRNRCVSYTFKCILCLLVPVNIFLNISLRCGFNIIFLYTPKYSEVILHRDFPIKILYKFRVTLLRPVRGLSRPIHLLYGVSYWTAINSDYVESKCRMPDEWYCDMTPEGRKSGGRIDVHC
jgi:hypothetical protein